MVGLIDLNTTEDDENFQSFASLSSPSNNSSFSGSSNGSGSGLGSGSGSVCMELWHACAGPQIWLPKRGSVVVYFPQGHLEQLPAHPPPLAAFDLPAHLFCRVLDVKLHAEGGSDDVYAQVSLVSESEQFEKKLKQGNMECVDEYEESEAAMKSRTPHMFCKTLTASDTSTHGGFSVPRRAAEDCFPPLNYTQQRPSQEIVAKDLHGVEWKFRHIYRGQPRRHLLTTGWSAFVNKKKLVSGDAVLFLRGEDGELRLGVRRAAHVKHVSSLAVLYTQQFNHSNMMDIVNSISTGNAFNVCYDPRDSSAGFIIPLHKFMKILNHSFSVGMRFKMRFETDDAADQRYTGIITGIGDLDPSRWPGSKWRSLTVRWDDLETNRHSRVSPWEIEFCSSVSGSRNVVVSGMKRSRSELPSSKHDFLVPDGTDTSNFRESSRFHKVLQGQEICKFKTLYDGFGSGLPAPHCSEGSATGNVVRNRGPNIVESTIPHKGIGCRKSSRFQEVLQGQEIYPSSPYSTATNIIEGYEGGFLGIPQSARLQSSKNVWSTAMRNPHMHPAAQLTLPSSVLFQQESNLVSNRSLLSKLKEQVRGDVKARHWLHDTHSVGEKFASFPHSQHGFGTNNGQAVHFPGLPPEHIQPQAAKSTFNVDQYWTSSCKSSCRLFGFSLTEDTCLTSKDDRATLKQGSFLPCVGENIHPQPPVLTNVAQVKGLLPHHSGRYRIC